MIRAVAVSLGATLDVRDIVQRHFIKLLAGRLHKLPLRQQFTLDELVKCFDSRPFIGEVHEVFDDNLVGPRSHWASIAYFISIVGNGKSSSDLLDLTMEVLPIGELSFKYFDQWKHILGGVSKFRQILDYLIKSAPMRKTNRPRPALTFQLSAESNSSRWVRYVGGTRIKLDLLDLAILNDVLSVAIEEMFKTYVFCTILRVDGGISLCLATRGIGKDWLVVGDKSSDRVCRVFQRVFQADTSMIRKTYQQTELVAYTLNLMDDANMPTSGSEPRD